MATASSGRHYYIMTYDTSCFFYGKLKPQTTIRPICGGDGAAVEQYGVFYDGKPEARASLWRERPLSTR